MLRVDEVAWTVGFSHHGSCRGEFCHEGFDGDMVIGNDRDFDGRRS